MKKYFLLVLRIATAVILIQTLRFKLTAHPDSVYIFSKVGMEPYGRIIIGVLELIAGLLILVNRSVWLGAGLSLGLMSGAIMMHLTELGIDVKGDRGTLFYTAVSTWLASLTILWAYRKDIPFIGKFFN